MNNNNDNENLKMNGIEQKQKNYKTRGNEIDHVTSKLINNRII